MDTDMKLANDQGVGLGDNAVSSASRPDLGPLPGIYLDYQATTPTDPRVVDAMLPYFSEKFGNPHSTAHVFGWQAEDGVDMARAQVAHLIGAEAREIVFTSGATESNNIAIKGLAGFYGEKKNHIITVTTEHKCVLETCRVLEQDGFQVSYMKPAEDGLIDVDQIADLITDQTLLVSVMAVNNEIGVIQPVAEIGALCRQKGVFFHSDCAQAFGKIPLDVGAMNIDLMSISGHKAYAPMGIGALYVRRRPRVRLKPLFDGGGQERGMRSGTLPTPLVVGLGMAAKLAMDEMETENIRLGGLQKLFLKTLDDSGVDYNINGDRHNRIAGNLNLSFQNVNGETLMASLSGLALSSGSACTSAAVEPSYVLKAIGLTDELAGASVRIGFGRFSKENETVKAASGIADAVKRLHKTND